VTDRPGFWKRFGSLFQTNSSGTLGEDSAFEAAYAEGFRLFRERKLDEALRAFSRAIQLRPEDTCSWEMFGSSLGNLGRYEESLRAFDRALELGHECENCWYNRSIAFAALGRRDETLKALEKVVQISPTHFRAWLDRGLILGGFWLREDKVGEPFDGRHDQAVVCLDKALAIDPRSYEAWFYRGKVLEKLCHQAQVRNRTTHITGAPPLPFEDLLRRATESFDRAAECRPNDSQARQGRDDLYTGLFGEDRANWPDH
jgi:tetratricopeptide (TPR) repeat protein